MIDSHAHLHDPAFEEDRAETLARAKLHGIETMIIVGTDLADSARAITIAEGFGAAAAIGIHPHEAASAPAELGAAFAELFARTRSIAAIGEIGLDYHYDRSPRETQRAILRAQLEIAAEHDLPVVFHEREALDDFIAILREDAARRTAAARPRLRGVVHCFTRDLAAARIYTEEFGLLLGIGGVLTFKTAEPLRDAVRTIGLDAIVLETDCPYLAPVPMRGQRNEPAFLRHTALRLAEILGSDLAQVAARTRENTLTLFPRLRELAELAPP
jgi:TatD DNase family protein